ncbi:MAG TPA: type II secretion system secretin GspD [Anaeromyxobacteraceae bacterium]|nr:type II secretion system secretin GspD [Anaeromyxobacteraceae bacterium]
MRTLLAAALLLPALALSQEGAPPPQDAQANEEVQPPPPRRPPRLRAGMPAPPIGEGPPPTAPSPSPPMPPPPAPAPAAQRTPATRPPPGSRAEIQLQPGQAGGTARADATCKPIEGKFLLAFNKADIVDLLEQASRWTCRNFAYTDEVARGKITLLSKTPVTPDEAYAAFLSALNANGIAIYQSGKYYRLVRIADAKKTAIPTLVGDEAEYAPVEQPITKLFRLHYVDPDQLRAVLGNFTSPQGADIQTIQPDILLITDLALNVRRIERMLEALDRPGSNDLVRVIQVQYAPARDVADKINQIFVQVPGGQPGRPAQKRPLIGGVATPGGAPPAPAAVEPAEISISKVVADERTNKLIVISDEKSYQRILDLVKQLDTPTAGEGTIHVIFLKNANAEDLANTLQSLATGVRRSSTTGSAPGSPVTPPPPGPAPTASTSRSGAAELFSGEVKITADKPSNSLVVIASASDFTVVQRLVEKLDRARREVYVEAVIMEVDISNNNQLGVAWHAAIPVNTAQGQGYIPLGFEPTRINSLNPSSVLSLGGALSGLVGPVSAQLKDIFPFPSMAVLIQALSTASDVNVLSTPHLIAQDNEESEIVVGQNVPFQAGYNPGFNTSLATSTTSSTSTTNVLASPYAVSLIAPIQRQNVDLKLKIKPQIHEGDMVRLDIEESQEEIVSNDPVLGPTTAKRSVKTKVVVKDQSTIVIGGLIQDRTTSTVSKVPLLGDIPVLGYLFRDNVTTKQKTNLLLLLTPNIIRDQSDFHRILERKQREQRELYELYYGKKQGFTLTDSAPRPGPLTRIRHEVQVENQKIENGGSGAPGERTVGPGGTPTPSSSPAAPPSATPALPPPAAETPAPEPAPPEPTAPASPPSPPATPPAAPGQGG